VPRPSDLAHHIPRLASARVACLGDLMLDRFVYGTVERVSPEAPVPILHVTGERSALGGVGNVTHNLVALGAHATCLAAVGEDTAGQEVRALLATLPHASADVLVEPGRQTTIKTRCIGGHQQIVRIDRETVKPVGADGARRLIDALERALADARVLVLSDYRKGVLDESLVRAAIARARALERPVIVDPKGPDYERYRGASYMTPNLRELAEATRRPVASEAEVERAARDLIERCALEALLVTRSEKGVTLITREGESEHVPTRAREVYDVSGAGDTVVAAFAAAHAAGLELSDCALLANAAAGLAVAKLGTAAVTAGELMASLEDVRGPALAEKLASAEEAARAAASWRARGLSVGFTNGCFDLLHPGHLRLIGEAKRRCDRLVVALNSDDSVRRLKGPLRPIQSESARAAILASMADVDLVVMFDEDTPLALIERVRPNVLIKGADYTVEQVVGAEWVIEHGGRVELIERLEGYSTSALVGARERRGPPRPSGMD